MGPRLLGVRAGGPAATAHVGLGREGEKQLTDGRHAELTRQDFEKLLAFRTSLRRFQRWSEDQAHAAGLTHVQHQLLVAVKGHPGDQPPTVGDLAGSLLQRHHSTVELVDRAATAGLVARVPDARDGRIVRVRLTELGERRLAELTPSHLAELRQLAKALSELLLRSADSENDAPPERRS